MAPILGLGAKQMRLGNSTSCTGVHCPTIAPLHATQSIAACACAVNIMQHVYGLAEGIHVPRPVAGYVTQLITMLATLKKQRHVYRYQQCNSTGH